MRAQRIAVPDRALSYLVVYSEGPNDPDSSVQPSWKFAQLVSSFPDVVTAYNLDSGSSATIVFQGQKINGPLSQPAAPWRYHLFRQRLWASRSPGVKMGTTLFEIAGLR